MLSKSTITELLDGKPSKKAVAEIITQMYSDTSSIVRISEPAVGVPVLPFEIGEKYYIRTVTHHQTGRVKRIIGKFLVLEDGAWIADSGRWKQAIETGNLDEVEPVDVDIFVNTDSIIDAYSWNHDLPRSQK